MIGSPRLMCILVPHPLGVTTGVWTSMIVFIIIYSLAAIALVRFGLVSLAAALFLTDFLLNAPMTADFSKWFIGSTIFVYASAVALALFAFYTALAGQRLWKEELFE